MSRHRNVRSMNFEDEYYDEDDYSHSYDDSHCVSPGTVAQFTFNRDQNVNLTSYMGEEEGIPEEEEEDISDDLQVSKDFSRPALSDRDEGKLNACLEEVRNILGESVPESVMKEVVLRHQFNLEASIDELLKMQDAPKPQRQPRQNRRSGSQGPTVILKTPPKSRSSGNDSDDVGSDSGNVTDSAEALSKVTVTEKNHVVKNCESTLKGLFIADADLKSNNSKALSSEESSPNQPNLPSSDSRYLNVANIHATSSSPELVETYRSVMDDSPMDFILDNAQKVDSLSTPKRNRFIPPLPKSSSRSKYEKVDVKEEYAKRQGGKDKINLVVIGHVDAGKSTLMGHLLYQLGNVNKRLMHKYEQESKKLGKGSFAFAWVLDETEEERARGVTMDIAQTQFETPGKIVTLLDAPGHRDFIPNMITGTAQADVGILVVNATKGEFETGFESGGQTREHALLARSLGVSQLIIAVNKMDTVDWSKSRYDEIVKKMSMFMKQAGYKEENISCIPCSGLTGENLAQSSKEPLFSSWYKGNTLVEQIDKFTPVSRPVDKPFRLYIGDIFKGMGGGISVTGKIASGSVKLGDRVLVMPAMELAIVKGITINEESVNCAFAGDHVTVVVTGVDITNLNIGSILCSTEVPMKAATRIRARVVLFNLELPMTKGYTVVFHYQSLTEPAIVKRLVSQLNKSSGEVIKTRPKCLTKNTSAVIEIEFERPICLELFKDNKDLGRFMLRNSGHTIAAGLIEEVLKTKAGDEVEASNSTS
ncbi:hypothetical protein ACJMK2_040522 [Sinanodonta woodiana]|uniref:Tr-type G domain-containing protein n=1 Tax=Sinanodonta woodiana TaxID=1069815 RepID=A0ABD3W194_SINWO